MMPQAKQGWFNRVYMYEASARSVNEKIEKILATPGVDPQKALGLLYEMAHERRPAIEGCEKELAAISDSCLGSQYTLKIPRLLIPGVRATILRLDLVGMNEPQFEVEPLVQQPRNDMKARHGRVQVPDPAAVPDDGWQGIIGKADRHGKRLADKMAREAERDQRPRR